MAAVCTLECGVFLSPSFSKRPTLPLLLLSKSRQPTFSPPHPKSHLTLSSHSSPTFPLLPSPYKFSNFSPPSAAAAAEAATEAVAVEEEEEKEPEPVEAQIAAEAAAEPPKGESVFAVVIIGSRQYIVMPGRFLTVQRLKGANVNDKIILNKVLLVGTRNETETKAYIGMPVVTNAAVHAVVEEQGLNKKVIVFKFKRKKNYKRNIGHRQPNTRIRITGITGYEDFPAESMPRAAPAP